MIRKFTALLLCAALAHSLTLPVAADMRDTDPPREPTAPGNLEEYAEDLEEDLTSICGDAVVTADQMRAYLARVNPDAPDYVDIYLEEGEKEGVRGDIAFAMSLLETGNFRFGGDVSAAQNNFCGLGATGRVAGASFDTPEEGIRAQIQHLKAYATTDSLEGSCVDPRFSYVGRGSAPYVEWLGIPDNPDGRGWAATRGYGDRLLRILYKMQNTPASGDL